MIRRTPRLLPIVAILVLGSLVVVPPLIAAPNNATNSTPQIDWVMLAVNMLGGLALFLYGMEQMAGGLKSAAGEKMKNFLAKATGNRFTAAATGAAVTAVIQSSSVTTVLAVSFVSAGLMNLTQTVGVIMGANVGTTITAQIIAFKVEEIALAIIAAGFAALFFSKREKLKQLGNIVMGLGLVFFGMGIMSEAMSPLRSYQPFIDFMSQLASPALGILTGALFTALVQSSSATTGIVIALGSQGLLSLPAGIAIIFGANIGTCVTAVLATLGKSREALRVAMIHVLFNVAGVVIWLPFISYLADFIASISPVADGLTGTAKLAAEVPRQIANAHAMFNISNTLLMLPLASLLAWAVKKLIPKKELPPIVTPKFLEPQAISLPSVALQNVRHETARLCGRIEKMLAHLPDAFFSDSKKEAEAIKKEYGAIEELGAEILRYLGQTRKGTLTDSESKEFQTLMGIVDILESISDVVAEDLVEIANRRRTKSVESSEKVRTLIGQLHGILCGALEDASEVIRDQDKRAAESIVRRKEEIYRLESAILGHQEKRFAEVPSDRLETFRLEMAVVERQRQIYSLIKRIARTVVPRP